MRVCGGGPGSEGMGSTYLVPTVCLCWFCWLVRQSFGSLSKGTDENGEPGPPVSRVHRGKCVGPSAMWGLLPQWRVPSLYAIVEYLKINLLHLFGARPPDVPFNKE